MKTYVGMAIWFRDNPLGPPSMTCAVREDEWKDAAKSQASLFGYTVAVDPTPYPSQHAALMAIDRKVRSGDIRREMGRRA